MEEKKLTAQWGQQHKSNSNHGEATGDAQAQDPRKALKSTRLAEPQRTSQATNLLRDSDPWRTEGTLRLAEVAWSRVCEVLILNYECTQVGLLLS